MPAKLNVGATRKITDGHYGSRGASVYLEIELDHHVTLEPAKLHERMRQLFQIVQQAVREELQRGVSAPSPGAAPTPNEKLNGSARSATRAQVKAIQNIAQQKGADLADTLHQRFGVRKPEELTVKQASALIDALKATANPSAA